MEFKRIDIANSDYLFRLRFLRQPAEQVYYYGKIPVCDGNTLSSVRFPTERKGRPKTVAIVGSRKMTTYGKNWAFKIARELAELGVIIVSGMAMGVDSEAHRGALAAGGKTLAFLGTPIDKIYPASNRKLFNEIIENGGTVMSEYAPGVKMNARYAFLTRNRLIAGVSDAVVIVEADERSGSLNTAAHAMEQGVPIFAVPGDLGRQMSRGCNQLFGKGAASYTCAEDVLNVLYPGGFKHRIKQAIEFDGTECEKAIFGALQSGVTSGEEILCRINGDNKKFMASDFNIAITTLEIKGVVKREYNNQWILA